MRRDTNPTPHPQRTRRLEHNNINDIPTIWCVLEKRYP